MLDDVHDVAMMAGRHWLEAQKGYELSRTLNTSRNSPMRMVLPLHVVRLLMYCSR